MKPIRRLALVLLVLCLIPALARAQVLQQVPADALVVIKVNKLKATSDKIAALATKLGVAEMNPALKDPLGNFLSTTGMKQGVDPNGEMAIVLLNAPIDRKKPPLMALVPVTDYKAFVASYPNARTDGEFSVVKVKNDPDDTYIANWGKYAAISDSKERLAKPSKIGLMPAGLAAKELSEKDICAYVNLVGAKDKILPQLKSNRQKMIAEFEANATKKAQLDPKFVPIARVALDRALDVVEQAVTDGAAGTWGLSFSDDGIRSSGLAEFQPGTPSAQRVAMLKPTDQPLLAGLPATKYMAFGGIAVDPATAPQLLNEFTAPIEKELANLGEDGKAIQNYLNALKATLASTKSSTFGMVAPSGALGQEAIFQIVAVATGDANKILDSQKHMFESQQALMNAMGGGPMKQQVKTSYTPNAKTIDGVGLNQFTTQINMQGGNAAQQQQAAQMMAMMYGPNGMNGYSGALGNDKVVTATGANDQLLQQLIAAAKAGQDQLSTKQGVQTVRAQLPKQRIGEAYIALDTIVNTVANYAKQFGMPVNLQLPQELPPIGAALTTEGSAIRTEAYVPAQLLQSVIAGVMQSYMQMQGAGAPPGGAGGPGGL